MPNKNYQPFLGSLDELGFATFKVFDDNHITALKHLYEEQFSTQQKNKLFASHNSSPAEKNIAVSNAIKAIVSPKLTEVFPGFDYYVGHFMVKVANTVFECGLHQDWNIVDERKYKTYQIWIPLQFTYPLNGGLFILPGSHRFFNNYRSGSYGIPMLQMTPELNKVCTDIIVPAGNIVAYHNSAFHGSYPNKTAEDRAVVLINLVERGAPTYYFHRNGEKNCTELYPLSSEQLVTHLPDLEKGITHALSPLTAPEQCEIDVFNNHAVSVKQLTDSYRLNYGNKSAQQLKQLHITATTELEEELNEKGFAVIDLLSADEVEVFLNHYKINFGQIDRSPGRFTTLQDTDNKTKQAIHNFIVKHIDGPLRKYFKDFIIPVSQFYTKKAFTSGDIDLHADSTLLLNHQLEPHYAIWVPMIEVDKHNGTLTVVPYSHKVTQALFASSLGGYHHQHTEWLRQFEVPLHLMPGQAVVFDNNLLHNSTANTSSFDRLVFTFRITHYASQYYSFFCANAALNDAVEISEETHDYYMNDNWDGNATGITGQHKGTYLHGITQVSKTELEKILGKAVAAY